MKKRDQLFIRSLASSLLIIFLFTSLITIAFNATPICKSQQGVIVTTKTSGNAPSDSQLPYEAKEKETEDRSEDRSTHFLYPITQELFSSITDAGVAICSAGHYEARSGCHASAPPIYLTNLTLLI